LSQAFLQLSELKKLKMGVIEENSVREETTIKAGA
jgi:hypothetical protein